MKTIKPHKALGKEYKDEMLASAHLNGLAKVLDVKYTIRKVREKSHGSLRIGDIYGPSKLVIAGQGLYTWIFAETPYFFKTSPVVSCTLNGTGYDIETANSFYRLEAEKSAHKYFLPESPKMVNIKIKLDF